MVRSAFRPSRKRGIPLIPSSVIPVLLLPGSATKTVRVASARRIWVCCLSQYPSGSASKQLLGTYQLTPEMREQTQTEALLQSVHPEWAGLVISRNPKIAKLRCALDCLTGTGVQIADFAISV